MSETIIRQVRETDCEDIIMLMKMLADYEKMSKDMIVSPEDIRKMIFEDHSLDAIIAVKDGKAIGMASFNFYILSTFSGKRVMYLEDLFIVEKERGNGLGKRIMKELCKIAKKKDCMKMEWKCLDWNKTSIDFYNHIGATSDNGWITFSLPSDNFLL